MRRHVRKILESEEGWEVCAEAATGCEAVERTTAKQPDIVVLDLSMPEMDGLEAARRIHEQFPQILIIIITMHDTVQLGDSIRALGVRTCIVKTELFRLVEAISSIWQERALHSVS
jgi:DNA-binding NarL/FixJ family response regulator